MSDLLQEIDEAVRRDNAAKFWKENGAHIIGGAIALVLMTGVFTAWNGYTLKKNMEQTNLLVSALSTPFPATALDAAGKSLKGSHRAVAALERAGALMQDKKTAEALTVLADLSADKSAPALWRDLATLSVARMRFEKGLEQADSRKLYDSLKPLLKDGNPWQSPAQLQAAIIAAEGLSDYTLALRHAKAALKDDKLPPTMRERAEALEHLYTMKASAGKTEPSADVQGSKG